MSGAQVTSMIEELDKAASLAGFISEQLFLIHEQKEAAMTIFQLAALSELVDGGLMNQSELLRNALT